MAVLGTLSSVNLIAGAAILGNVGGTPIGANTGLTSNVNSYTSVDVVNTFAGIASSGYVSINIVANNFPALTNAIPVAYQGSLGSGTMTSAIALQNSDILGNGDLGKFQQILNASIAFVTENNQLIISTINANNVTTTTGFTTQDNVVTGGFSDLTLSLDVFGTDLSKTGYLINFENLGNLGTPAALLATIGTYSFSTPALNDALLESGVPQELIDDLSNAVWTDQLQKKAYQAMTKIVGNDLTEIKKLLKITTPNLSTMADLLNPVKIFPNSFNTFTAPTNNGLRGIYIDSTGLVNSNLETELPESVLAPLQGNQNNSMPYTRLSQIIPPDQALANKAICAALQQIKNIFDSNPILVAGASVGLETNYGLGLINALTEPLPPNVITYFTQTMATGSGKDGLFLLTDIIGLPTGYITNDQLSNTVEILNSMTASGQFDALTNPTTGVYTVMENTIAGDYTTQTDPGPPEVWDTVIPFGLPGAGTYTSNTAGSSIASAFTSGLNPAMLSAVANIISTNPTQVSQTTSNFSNICIQIINENTNQNLAGIDFANLQANLRPFGLVNSLEDYGTDTVEGGAAFVMESLSQTNTIGGQAIVATMRAARNQVRLNDAGINTDIVLSEELAQPQAQLGQSQYTVSESVTQKII